MVSKTPSAVPGGKIKEPTDYRLSEEVLSAFDDRGTLGGEDSFSKES